MGLLHFVTDELDEGPIIGQDVISVNIDLAGEICNGLGEMWRRLSSQGLWTLVLNDRVFLYGNKTIVFK